MKPFHFHQFYFMIIEIIVIVQYNSVQYHIM